MQIQICNTKYLLISIDDHQSELALHHSGEDDVEVVGDTIVDEHIVSDQSTQSQSLVSAFDVCQIDGAGDQCNESWFEMALVLGGMDTEGEIFDDCLGLLLNESSASSS